MTTSTARSRKIEAGRYEHLASGWIVYDFHAEHGHGWGWVAYDPASRRDVFDPVPTKADALDLLDAGLMEDGRIDGVKALRVFYRARARVGR